MSRVDDLWKLQGHVKAILSRVEQGRICAESAVAEIRSRVVSFEAKYDREMMAAVRARARSICESEDARPAAASSPLPSRAGTGAAARPLFPPLPAGILPR